MRQSEEPQNLLRVPLVVLPLRRRASAQPEPTAAAPAAAPAAARREPSVAPPG